jgi:hypothetical protein
MTDEQILNLAEEFNFQERFIEYDRLGFEINEYIASGENLIEFALAIHKIGFNKGYATGAQR